MTSEDEDARGGGNPEVLNKEKEPALTCDLCKLYVKIHRN